MPTPEMSPPPSLRHGLFEDAQALFAGTLFVAMALMLFNQAGLLVGGTAVRIATGSAEVLTAMRCAHVLTDAGGYLYTRYVRIR